MLDGENQIVWKNAVLRRWHRVPIQPVPTGVSWKQFYHNCLDAEFVCFKIKTMLICIYI